MATRGARLPRSWPGGSADRCHIPGGRLTCARTMNTPPGRPLALCAHAFAASSLTSRIASSAAGGLFRARFGLTDEEIDERVRP